MNLSLPALLVLLAPPIAAILMMRPSWQEYALLVSPFIVTVIVALLLFRFASIALWVIALGIGLCTLGIEAEDRGFTSSSGAALSRIAGTRERERPPEHAHRQSATTLQIQRRTLLLARMVGAEFGMLGFAFLAVERS